MSDSNPTRVTWLGHSTVLVQTPGGANILIDPFIEHNPKYPSDFELPSNLHYILLTHGHGDHISDVVPVAKKHGSKVVAIYELANYIAGKGVENTIGMNLGGSVELEDVTATMVDARHSAGAQDEQGVHYVGVAAGYVLTLANGLVLYHAGDTSPFRDMELIRELYRPKVAMLPIGGFYTMGPKEAALAVRFIAPEVVLPLHWGTFPPLKGTPEQLAALVEPGVKVVSWKPGEEFTV
ncbi:MAG TPA: metal-dependent hydrolase [Terracidiphilus sp.]|nr:metal-dependent hydrolase [Terracidiphilus sp.]